MILDYLCQLATDLAVTASDAYTELSYDLGNVTPKQRVGTGRSLSIVFIVKVAGAGDGGSFTDTCDFLAVESANADLSSHVEIIKRRVPGAQLTAGSIIEVPLPSGKPVLRYLGGRVELGADDTVTVDAYVMEHEQIAAWLAYAKSYVI